MASSEYDVLYKVVLMGDSGIGKSSLLFRFADDHFPESYLSTLGVNFKVKNLKIGGQTVKLQVCHTTAQGRFRTITSNNHSGTHAVVLAFDITDRFSFNTLKQWLVDIKRDFSADTKIILVGTKSDLVEKREVTHDEALEFADNNGLTYIETSAKHGTNVNSVFETLSERLLEKQPKHIAETSSCSEEAVKETVGSTAEESIEEFFGRDFLKELKKASESLCRRVMRSEASFFGNPGTLESKAIRSLFELEKSGEIKDSTSQAEVKEIMKRLLNRYPIGLIDEVQKLLAFVNISAKDGIKVDSMFEVLSERLLEKQAKHFAEASSSSEEHSQKAVEEFFGRDFKKELNKAIESLTKDTREWSLGLPFFAQTLREQVRTILLDLQKSGAIQDTTSKEEIRAFMATTLTNNFNRHFSSVKELRDLLTFIHNDPKEVSRPRYSIT